MRGAVMRLLRFAFLLLFALTPAAISQHPDQLYTASQQQLDVTKVVLAQEARWNTGDLDGYLSFYKDALDTEAFLAEPTFGLEAIRKAYHINFPNRDAMGAIENSELTVRPLGDNFAIATGKYHLQRTKKAGGDAIGTFTQVFEKTPTGWKIIFSENT
jgi:ketosteroid isomerase-like protein